MVKPSRQSKLQTCLGVHSSSHSISLASMFPILDKQAVRKHWQPFTHLNPYQHLGWLTSTALLLLAISGSPVAAQTTLVEEEFDDNETFGWSVGVANSNTPFPCLTAGDEFTPLGSIGACNPAQPDVQGEGALRITTSNFGQSAFAFYDFTIPSGSGLVITFDYFSYGGTEIGNPPSTADGVTFFLFSGETTNPQPGAFGGSLGYAQRTGGGDPAGLTNGYVGVGLDEYGNFANDGEGRGAGCQNPSPFGTGERVLDSVTLRGSGNGNTGYCYLENSGVLPQGIDEPDAPIRDAAQRRVRITLTTDNTISVELDFTGTGNNFQQVLEPINLTAAPGQAPVPSTFKFGFASSTGDATNIHEIRNLRITTVAEAPEPDLEITKSHTGNFVAGETGEYTLTVRNVGDSQTYGPTTVTDTLPPGFSFESFTGDGWNCSENPPGTVTCVYSPETDNPAIQVGESRSVVINVNVTSTPGDYINTATVSTTADDNPTNDTAEDATTVTDVLTAGKDGTLDDANNNGAADPGEAITYTVTISNVSRVASTGTSFTDQIPEGTTYIPGTTTLNGTPVDDDPGDTMPFSGDGALVNSVGASPGEIAPDDTATVQFQVSINNPPGVTQIENQGAVASDQVILPPLLTEAPVTGGPDIIPIGPVGEVSPRLRLVKRITSVNTTTFTNVVDDPADVNDNPGIWPTTLQPVGLSQLDPQTPVESGDEVEYTIYFISDGSQESQNVRLCDAIPLGTTFIPESFGSSSGILLNQAGTQVPQTNAPDTDQGTFSSPLTPVTAPCSDTNNPNGSVLVQLGTIPNIAPNNVGFVRFRVRID